MKRFGSKHARPRTIPLLAVAPLFGAGTMVFVASTAGPAAAQAAPGVSAVSAFGVLAVVGDAQDNTIVISRDAAGRILVNNGDVRVIGSTPTVANTTNDRGRRWRRQRHHHARRGERCTSTSNPHRRHG